ncbi:DUF3597 domain-containing protein [Eleftheria terrae]|uniref:DUF3597 domain-containing protein n=1 Tax=Eleftheria terrae TaxID=1597781 RepID=UPI00263A4C9C|nr:DUF3597 domain-containing protein [Eleftheria terrae]WKB53593.1 DUF3597 domain-containing protein [Eleftheria terrae]
MSLLKDILKKIFPAAHAAPTPVPAQATPAPSPAAAVPAPSPAQGSPAPAPAQAASPASPPGAAATPGVMPAAASAPVDVAAILDAMNGRSTEKLNWRTSIVDLLKLLQLDSSLAARKALAEELHYSGDTGDSATMNIWLHKQVMKKLADNGGQVPADLKD